MVNKSKFSFFPQVVETSTLRHETLSNLDKLESDLVSGIKNNCKNYTEMANHLADGLVFFCFSYICISIQLRLYHNQLKCLVLCLIEVNVLILYSLLRNV